jgi:mono/diheme cytochrome c family protein
MKVIVAIVIIVIVGGLLGLGVISSGLPDISAANEHNKLTLWVLNETMERSVKRHAKDITAPSLNDQVMIQKGFGHYDAMCATCHGAPGVSRSEIGRGLYPRPPSLAAVLDEWTPEQLFWITKNGVKLTGMPAFGKTHTDDELWAIIAFVEKLPDIEPDDYLAMRAPKMASQPADTTKMSSPEQREHRDNHRH